MARLVLIDTSDPLPGLLPLHGWSALMASELVLLGAADHPFAPHLDVADLRYEVVPESGEGVSLTRSDLLSGLSPEQKARAGFVVDRARREGEVAYLFGAADSEAFTRTLGMEAARSGVEVEVVYFGVAPAGSKLLELVAVEERLLAPGGCPWDREQTHRSLGRYAVEEVYELLEAIESGEPDAIREELGDVLLQVVFHAQMAANSGEFTIDDVASGIAEKLVRRHPHVFGDVDVADADEVVENWEQLKAAEKPEREGVFDGVVRAQPALALIEKLQRRAAKAGFDPAADASQGLDAVTAGVERFTAADGEGERERALGDLLAAVVAMARRHGIDPEAALRATSQRFTDRFEGMAQAADRPLAELSRAEQLELWGQAET